MVERKEKDTCIFCPSSRTDIVDLGPESFAFGKFQNAAQLIEALLDERKGSNAGDVDVPVEKDGVNELFPPNEKITAGEGRWEREGTYFREDGSLPSQVKTDFDVGCV